jgi:VanZ family protein
MGFGLAVACIDETIQIFTPGRASSLIDVWIDASGFALGLAVIHLTTIIYNKIKGE